MSATKIRSENRAEPGWLERFGEYCYKASMPRVVQYFRNEATFEYESMINDLDRDLAPEMEDVIAAQLPVDQGYLLHADRVLLPAMAERLNADLSVAGQATHRQLSGTCQGCTQVGRCWLALRRGTRAAELERFCPNSQQLIALQPAQ
ncbi:hypothetical protein E4656_12395 [Natronospirillum operosum]|uniref:DUF6455 domain-containing protein n=1 Tax=Natronospirillum operosum TaxID=2759953 RepID=A0A4Z0W6T8_9GAMM|nr:DUF6455 family protein [Natronospirillum operosum]TGG92915.1 hypothetical protein E4656_12395 [Natronospirillum operosum]